MAVDNSKKDEVKKSDDKSLEEDVAKAPAVPPLEAAARRLERLLGGGVSDKDKMLHSYINPAKIVRRWLGTASGAAGDATLESIASAARTLLDPEGMSAEGKALLTASGDSMETEDTNAESRKYLTKASEREVETWLLSLMVRLSWREKRSADAYDLAQKTVAILTKHVNVAASNVTNASGPTMASLFPLLARMYRYRSLVAESLPDNLQIAHGLREDMIKAHGMATLRRDIDSQATLLNLMLHDLLNSSQGKRMSTLLAILMFFQHTVPPTFSHVFFFVKSSRRRSCLRTPPSQTLHQTTNFAAICITVVASRHFVWSTHQPFLI